MSEIHLARSADAGKTFSDRIVAEPAGQAFLPAVAVLRDGTIGVLWDDTRNDRKADKQLTTDVWLSRSADGGATWKQSHVAGPFDALTASETSSTGVAGHFLGDYQALVALPGAFGAVFAASKPLATAGTVRHLLRARGRGGRCTHAGASAPRRPRPARAGPRGSPHGAAGAGHERRRRRARRAGAHRPAQPAPGAAAGRYCGCASPARAYASCASPGPAIARAARRSG